MARTAKPWEELTEEQRKNRLRNERAKRKKASVQTKVVHMVSKKEVEKDVKEEPGQRGLWKQLGLFLITPTSVFQIISIVCIVSYLVYQFYLFDDLITGLIVEFLAIVYAVMFSRANTYPSKYLSAAAILVTISFSAFNLHSGMHVDSRSSDEGLNALRNQRQIVDTQIKSIQKSHDELPSSYVTRKSQMRSDIQNLSAQLSSLDARIDTAPYRSSDNFASIMIRIMAMLASMALIHGLVGRLHASPKEK